MKRLIHRVLFEVKSIIPQKSQIFWESQAAFEVLSRAQRKTVNFADEGYAFDNDGMDFCEVMGDDSSPQ